MVAGEEHRRAFQAALARGVGAVVTAAAASGTSASLRREAGAGAAPASLARLRRRRSFAVLLPGVTDSAAGEVLVTGSLNFLNLYNTVLVARLVLTWFPSAPMQIVRPLSTLCDPYLNAFRGLIPPLGQIDLSPILAFTVLNVFQSAAEALPAELPGARRVAAPRHALRLPAPWAQRNGAGVAGEPQPRQ